MSLISDRLEAVALCLCQQITTDGSPPTCFCGVIPGDAAVADYGGDCNEACGVAWVRMVSAYPSVAIGQPDESTSNCLSQIGMDVEVGILRCMEVPEDGGPPTDEELLATFRQQSADCETILRALNCCPDLHPKDMILGAYNPMGPQGGIIGGAWTFSTAV